MSHTKAMRAYLSLERCNAILIGSLYISVLLLVTNILIITAFPTLGEMIGIIDSLPMLPANAGTGCLEKVRKHPGFDTAILSLKGGRRSLPGSSPWGRREKWMKPYTCRQAAGIFRLLR